jgi:hypothetical protein
MNCTLESGWPDVLAKSEARLTTRSTALMELVLQLIHEGIDRPYVRRTAAAKHVGRAAQLASPARSKGEGVIALLGVVWAAVALLHSTLTWLDTVRFESRRNAKSEPSDQAVAEAREVCRRPAARRRRCPEQRGDKDPAGMVSSPCHSHMQWSKSVLITRLLRNACAPIRITPGTHVELFSYNERVSVTKLESVS